MLPPFLESLLKDITSYFSRSSKRQNDFTTIQDVVQAVNHRIPKLAQTRWLSRENVVSRILEQWKVLVLYFQSESRNDKVDGASKIYKLLVSRGAKHTSMFCFLQYVLSKVNALNLEFQSEQLRLHKLHLMVSTEYKVILSFFMKEEVFTQMDLSNIDPKDKKIHKPIENIYLGGRTMSLLEEEPIVDEENNIAFRNDCLKFLIELCVQIKQRFPFSDDNIIAKLKVLDPNIAHSKNSLMSISSLETQFKTLIPENKLNDLDDEYRSFQITKDQHHFNQNLKIPEFWYKLREIKNGLGQPKYINLSDFMANMTLLPQSSACVERIFSQVNTVKTKKTNKLKANTTRDRILAKQHVTKGNSSWLTWQPSKALLKDFENDGARKRYSERLEKPRKEQGMMNITFEDSDGE